MRESVDNLLEDVSILGLLDAVVGASITSGEVNGEALQGGSKAKGKVASDTASVKRFLAAFDDAV